MEWNESDRERLRQIESRLAKIEHSMLVASESLSSFASITEEITSSSFGGGLLGKLMGLGFPKAEPAAEVTD